MHDKFKHLYKDFLKYKMILALMPEQSSGKIVLMWKLTNGMPNVSHNSWISAKESATDIGDDILLKYHNVGGNK